MKKKVLFATLIIGLAIAGCSKAEGESKNKYVAARSGLNLRSNPGKSSGVVTLIPFGSEVIVEKSDGNKIFLDGEYGEWVNVKFGDKTGWIFSGFLSDSKPFNGDKKSYKTGDKGPAGGYVFYDKGTFSNGWQYLEAAPAKAGFQARWGGFAYEYSESAGHTVEDTGGGKYNTQTIVKHLQKSGETGKAAQLCADLKFAGFNDWFLPSKDELNLMYKNLKERGIGDFSDDDYWSSSESYTGCAWSQRFGSGDQANHNIKDSEFSVRAVRAF